MAFGTSGKGTSLFIIQLCCLLLVWITAILRAWVGIIRKSCTMDDWFMYLSVVSYLDDLGFYLLIKGIRGFLFLSYASSHSEVARGEALKTGKLELI